MLSHTQTIRIGEFSVGAFVEREFRLDGGTMFGVIPRVMWEKLVVPDEKNTVAMQTNLFVVTTPAGDKVLLDSGLGDALSEFDRKMYAVTTPSNMTAGLAALGHQPEEINWVILTHLHTDHANGVFAGDPDNPELFFPNATYIVQHAEWESANHPNERTAAVYYPGRLAAITNADKLKLVSGTREILPGITVEQTGGHTSGHQGVRIESGGEAFVYYADIFPSRFHLKTPFVASVDTHPLDTLQIKKKLLPWCHEKDAVIGFDHDTEYLMGRLVQGKKWLDVGPV
jgi:glyoxylase-like metal-dependent hydrolase (beta-lactamase superfamily II)